MKVERYKTLCLYLAKYPSTSLPHPIHHPSLSTHPHTFGMALQLWPQELFGNTMKQDGCSVGSLAAIALSLTQMPSC